MKGTKGIKVGRLTIEKLFTLVSEYNLWCYYIGFQIKFGKRILSPLRQEKNPSAGFFVSKLNNILLKDFSTGEVISLFGFLKLKYNWTIPEALKHINSDFNLGYSYPKYDLTNSTPVIHKDIDLKEGQSVKIEVKRGSWSNAELNYWSEYNITKKSLDKFNVKPLQCYWITKNSNIYRFCREPGELLFVFSFGNAKYKIYRPFGNKKDNKWYSNVPGDMLMGYDELAWVGDVLIITKGMKELCILDELGYNVVALQGESMVISETLANTLLKRFERVYTLLDNDKAGLAGMARNQDLYGFKPIVLPDIYLPKGKDLGEISKMTNLQTVKAIVDASIKTK